MGIAQTLGLEKTAANYVPLSPLSFIERTARIYPDRPAIIYHGNTQSWAETYRRCRRLAAGLRQQGIGHGDVVSVLAPNVPAMLEAHFGVPMCGAVLNTINTRLDARTVAYILEHAEAKLLLVDRELRELALEAVGRMSRPPRLVDIDDPLAGDQPVAELSYEALLDSGDPDAPYQPPTDEWDAVAVNYTSGTTGEPKGVVYHHRGAYLNAVANILATGMGHHPVYLWTLPLFHCNGWCFPWTLAALAGVNVCLRKVDAAGIFQALAEHNVSHFSAAPTVLNMLVNAPPELATAQPRARTVEVTTGGAAPPPSVIEAMEALGMNITQYYGLTEVYGPASYCAWHPEWDELPAAQRRELKARVGVRNHMQEGMMVADPETLEPVPADGTTVGEILFRGNLVMKGYLKAPQETAKAFAGGWFHTGDLAVVHPDGYVQIRDRSKDIVISGGENISSIEVENVLYRHPAVEEAAVVARPDPKWGETPCAFVALREGRSASEAEIIAFCRKEMASFKAPKTVIFGPLPKTATGKIQKFLLRERARQLEAVG